MRNMISAYSDAMRILHKAISSSSVSGNTVREFIKEDLEGEAYNQLWNEEDPDQMVMLKMIGRVGAKQTQHQYTRLDSYGNLHSEAAFAPDGLPGVEDFSGERIPVQLKPYGQVAQVQGLAALEESISALGKDNIVDIDLETVRRLLMYKINIDIHEADTRLTHNPNKFKGILQLIDEGTRATGATTPNADHIVDMRGENLSMETSVAIAGKSIREKAETIQKRSGKLRWIFMATNQMTNLENQLDSSKRYLLSQTKDLDKYIVGATIDGAKTASGTVLFAPDVALSTRILTGKANDAAIEGAPNAFTEAASGQGTFGAPAAISPPSGYTSNFIAIDVLNGKGTGSTQLKLAYHIVALNEIGASIAAASSSVTLTAGQVISIEIRPRGGEVAFKIYRGIRNSADTAWVFEPEFIAQIPNGSAKTNTTPITFIDDNEIIPGTTVAFGLNLNSEASQTFARGGVPTNLSNKPIKSSNSVSLVQLTNMFRFDLAKLSWLAAYELLAWVLAPQVEKPYQNVVWLNCGRKQIVDSY